MSLNKRKIKQKIIIFGTPTIGKSYFAKKSNYHCWDSDLFYDFISSIEENHFNSLVVDIKTTKKIFLLFIDKIINSNYDILLFSILPIQLITIFKHKRFQHCRIFFIARNPIDLMEKWSLRDGVDINESHAFSCYDFVIKQSELINKSFIEIGKDQYLSDIFEKLISK